MSASALAMLLPPGVLAANIDQPPSPPSYETATNLLLTLKTKFAPDSHLTIFQVGLDQRGSPLVLTGYVDRAEVKAETVRTLQQAGVQFEYQLTVLPSPK